MFNNRFKSVWLLFFFILFNTAFFILGAQEGIRISVSPVFSMPLGESADLFNYGIGGNLEGRIPLGEGLLEGFGQINFLNAQLQEGAGNLQLAQLGGGLYAFPLRAGAFSAGGFFAGGLYLGFFGDNSPLANPYLTVGAAADLDLGKGLQVSFLPAYRYLVTRRDGSFASFYNSMDFSVQLTLEPSSLSAGTRRSKVKILSPEFNQVFPVIYKYYNKNPIGTVSFINQESTTITDVKVEFFVPKYMDGPQTIAELDEVAPRAEVEVPITALFRNDVLNITEADSAQAQITVSYTLGKAAMASNKNEALRIYDRNAITWDDDRKAAAFVTAKDPTIMKFSRNVTSEINRGDSRVINRNLADAIALFESLREYGIAYKIDPDSSYEILSGNAGMTDYLQFPVQTLDYKTGDCDDLSILYSSLLEAVSVETAFITTPGHIFMAFALGMNQAEASKTFSTLDKFIFEDENTWVPVEVTLLNEGFFKAWDTGAKQWNASQSQNNGVLYPTRKSWTVFEPTWFGAGEDNTIISRFPDMKLVSGEYTRSLNQFVQVQIGPMVKRLEESLAVSPSPRLNNRLGALYARYGMLDQAERQFKQAARANYVPSLVNLGNIAFIKDDFRGALAQYEQAYRQDKNSTEVLLGMARTRFELGEYDKAGELYRVAEVMDPEKATAFAYLTGGSTEAGRASDARERKNIEWSDD